MVYVVIAVIVFVLSGVLAMAGLGAAFLFVPIFYWLGVPLPVATSTALLLNVVSLSFASATYWRAHLVNLALGTRSRSPPSSSRRWAPGSRRASTRTSS